MPGELNSPYRRDPFTGDFYPKWNEADEVHVAALQESNGLVGFFLFEAPQLRQPSDFICAVLDDEYDETGTPLAENARLDAPDSDEFRVDYDADGYFGTGFVEVHESRAGQFFRVGYWGLGTPPRWETHLRAALTVSENFAVAGDLEVSGDLVINDGENVFSVVGSVISAHENRVRNIANAVDADDAVPLGQAGELVEQHGVERLSGSGSGSGSGTWTRPRGVSKVFLVAIGGGGSGAVNGGGGGGGGGGAAVYGLVDLDAIDPDETDFAYVVGGAGVDTTIFGAVAKAGASGSGVTGGAGGAGSTIPAEMIGREAVGGTGANGSGGTGGGGGAAAGGLGGTGANGSGSTGGAATGFFSGSGGNGTLTNGAAGVSFGGGGGGGQTTGGAGANGFIFLIY